MNHFLKNALFIGLSAFSAIACTAEPNTNFMTFLPGVAANPSQSTLFTAGTAGGIIAINLPDGTIRWRSQRALEALGFVNGAVIAQAGVDGCSHCMQVVWLSDADGQELRTSKTIAFPGWVSIAPVLGKQFTATVEARGESLALHWKASSHYAGGAHPTRQVLADFEKDAAGTFRIDAQGRASAEATPPNVTYVVPAALRDVETTTYWNCTEWRDVPVVAGNAMLAFDLAVRPNGQTLSARRWRLPTGQLDSTRQLAQGSNLELKTSPDSRYLFVHDGALQTDGNAPSRWQVYSLSTLRLIASIPYPAGQVCANVAADNVVIVIEKNPPLIRGGGRSRDLVAYSTSSSELIWSVELRGDPQQTHPR